MQTMRLKRTRTTCDARKVIFLFKHILLKLEPDALDMRYWD